MRLEHEQGVAVNGDIGLDVNGASDVAGSEPVGPDGDLEYRDVGDGIRGSLWGPRDDRETETRDDLEWKAEVVAAADAQADWLKGRTLVLNGTKLADDFEPGTDVRKAVARIVARHAEPGVTGRGYDGEDLAVWKDGRLLAVVMVEEGGRSQATWFGDAAFPRQARQTKAAAPSTPLFNWPD